MATSIFTGRDGALRLYDSTPTPYYIELPFVQMNLSAPIGRSRPGETLTQVVEGLAYRPESITDMLAPQSLTFSLLMEYVDWVKIREAFGVDYASASSATTTWTVNGDTWLSTYGDSTLYDHDGTAIVRPSALSDSRKVCVNVEGLWTNPSTTAFGYQYSEVYFEPSSLQLTEGAAGNTVSASGLIYGAIAPITSFTAGTLS